MLSKLKGLSAKKYYPTKNSRGTMHPLSAINVEFSSFSSENIVVDMGCAYGNTTIAALEAGAKKVIACDMEKQHLDQLEKLARDKGLDPNLEIRKGIFPNDYDFQKNSIDGFHVSHILEYLGGNDIEKGLNNIFSWLKPSGKLFILVYTVFIEELNNSTFKEEYARRKTKEIKWPGFFENYNDYCIPVEFHKNFSKENKPSFPASLHMFEAEILRSYLQEIGFVIEKAEYLNGKENFAVEETWLDGKELLGVIARKPD